MTDTAEPNSESPSLFFFQGLNQVMGTQEAFKRKIKELCNVKHLNFLFGAGTSSGAIPTMNKIKARLDEKVEGEDEEIKKLYQSIQKNNLEDVLNILYAQRFYLKGVDGDVVVVKQLIKLIQDFMFSEINVSFETEDSLEALELYKIFYNKLALRNKDVSRINVFTTNNDLFNERALDHLNINYNNGFGGGLERHFNPARFRYTYSKKVDLNMEKFEPIDNMVYLYKLHGSINWKQSADNKNSLFDIEEIAIQGGEEPSDSPALIYPTPLKQNQSLGAPYADLIREFQAKLTLPNSVLFIIGYSFSDEHLNNIIYQALASNTSMSVVVFGDPDCSLSKIGDSRIYRFHGSIEDSEGEFQKVHYFEHIVKNIFPDVDEKKEQTLLDEFVKQLANVDNQNNDENR